MYLSVRVQQFVQALEADFDREIFEKVASAPGFCEVVDASDYVAQNIRRHPEAVIEWLESPWFLSALPSGQMRAELCGKLEHVQGVDELARILRQFRRLQMIRVIWRDILQLARLPETLADLSELADICVDQALRRLYEWAVQKSGTPRNPDGVAQELVVLGMGKLGARELNLSSDIDLIFLYPERGETDGRRPIDNETFFTRLARQLIKVIGETTADGFVFRVDTRLRPFGDAGPLVIPMGFLEDYLTAQAREWERYAMVKARVISGSRQSKKELWSLIRPFVYRRYLDYGAIESIRRMKKLINQEIKSQQMDANIKLGLGGIRELEFIGQAFQLIRGGHDPDLQIRPIQQVLKVLGQKSLMDEQVVEGLLAAYEFLRLTENRLQAWRDEQTHVLPEDPEAQARLARSMDFDSWADFSQQLKQHRHSVHESFEQIFAEPQQESEVENLFVKLWEALQQDEPLKDFVKAVGFTEVEKVERHLKDFYKSPACRFMGENGRRRLNELMPLLLDQVVQVDGSDQLIAQMIGLLQSVAKRTSYLALMVENPGVLSHLLKLMGKSQWVALHLIKYPLLLDELIDPARLYSPLDKQALKEDLQWVLSAVREDEEQILEKLRYFVHTRVMRVAAADITGAIPVNVVSDYLTYIAEVVAEYVLTSVYDKLVKKYGIPQQINGASSGFVIIAFGKLGGMELGYSSDLDLVFLHGSESVSAETSGDKAIANDVFYARMAQRIIHEFTTRMASGVLYDIDMRLRPNGKAGLMVTSLQAFEKYESEEAWTWEHQALIRARAVAGDPQTIQAFESIRRQILEKYRESGALQKDVREMREKMRESLDKSDDRQFDLKQGAGGIADIEFMVQYAVLRWANQYPDLLDWTDNARLLNVLASHDLLPQSEADSLLEAYWAYRAKYHRLSLQNSPSLVAQTMFVKERERVSANWQRLMVEDL